MILFENDWVEYPGAVVHESTTNESFIHVSALLKKMGVKNYAFMLSLMQPHLADVDPFDPNLTEELKADILMECIHNPWYFFREIARLPPNSGPNPIRFKANRANISLIWCFFNHVDYMLIQPRQTGKSGSTDCLDVGIMNLWALNTTVNLITKDHSLRAINIERLKGIRDWLPSYIYQKDRADADNRESFTIAIRNNQIKTAVSRNSPADADKVGRGATTAITLIDEISYIANNWISVPAALSAGSAARDQAKEAKQIYGNIYLTTPGNLMSKEGAYAYRFMMSGAQWSEGYYDMPNEERLHRAVGGAAGKAGRVLLYGQFNHRQLGYTDEWVMRKIIDADNGRELAERDYLNIWTMGTGESPLDDADRERIRNSEKSSAYTEISNDGYLLEWYVGKEDLALRLPDTHIVFGLDTSDALGGENDAIGLIGLDVRTHDVIASGRYNETNLHKFAHFLVELLVRYPNSTIIFEKRSSATAIFDIMVVQLLIKGIDPFKRMYNRIVDERDTRPDDFHDISRGSEMSTARMLDKYKRDFGFATSGSGKFAREDLYNRTLSSMVRHGAHRMHSQLLINEILGLVSRNGRLDHKVQAHDDVLIAALLAHWFCINAKNLDYYGIDRRIIFCDASEDKESSEEQQYREFKLRQARSQFDAALTLYKESTDEVQRKLIENKLRLLSTTFSIDELSGVSIDDLLVQVDEARNQKKVQEVRNKRLNHSPNNRRVGGSIRRYFI